MGVVRGRIEVKGTRLGVSGVLVVALATTGKISTKNRKQLGATRALGSAMVSDGAFEIRYAEEPTTSKKVATRPSIAIQVLAPEENGKGLPQRIVYQSDVRANAALEEFFFIHIDEAELKKHEISAPVSEGKAIDPDVIKSKVATELDRQKNIRVKLHQLARKEVDAERALESQSEEAVKLRVLQHLTQVAVDTPAWKRFVQPGADVRQIVRSTQQREIETVINTAPPRTTYLALSSEEYQALLDSSGQPVPELVEAALRGTNDTPSRLRTDPLAIACARREEQNPFDPPPPPTEPETPPEPDEPSGDVEEKVGSLLRSVRPPEEILIPANTRPDQTAIDRSIGSFSLGKGPADVPALYDFHNLQIAFPHVWEDARAAGVIEEAKALYRKTLDRGGDPDAALAGGGNPLRALAREARVTEKAGSTGVVARLAIADFPNIEIFGIDRPGNIVPENVFGEIVGALNESTIAPVHENYPFTLFAAGSVNFGLLITYQQRWEPRSYQAGQLVKTLTLAPKETVSFTTRQTVKTSMSQKQINASQALRKEDAESTQREEAEIVARADARTNFSLSSSGGYDLGPLGEGDVTSTFGKDASSSSQETKKAFREAVRKSAQEFRDERRMEVETAESFESETTEKREVSNPNDELPVTYLFYELQRRYRVFERLHRIMPVALVAQPVPAPAQVNEAWVLRHDWIIKRFLLDDSFLPALRYLATQVQGDRIVLTDMRDNVTALRATVRELKDQLVLVRDTLSARYGAIQKLLEAKAGAEQEEGSESAWEKVGDFLGDGDEDMSLEAIRIREDAARDAYEKAVQEEKDLRARLEREVTALQIATETYTKARAANTNQQVQVDRLIRHVRDNILHYMQGIWSYEHPDQRLFRHHTLEAARLTPREKECTLELLSEWPVGVTPVPNKSCYAVTFTIRLDDDLDTPAKKATLAELVELDKPLGFKGNYIIFPLKESNALTDFMMAPYLDRELGLRDPDALGNWTLEEFSRYVACLREKLGDAFSEVEDELREQYRQLLMDPLRDGEEIVVPTQSLFMEALVGTHPLMEDFKLLHRLLDVMKVKSEVRGLEFDNIRRAARILGGDLGDPDVESVKNVFYRGETPPGDGDE